jgi:hypothetical protein
MKNSSNILLHKFAHLIQHEVINAKILETGGVSGVEAAAAEAATLSHEF